MRTILLLAAVLLLAGGCTRRVTIASDPPGARVELDDDLCGYTPLALHLDARVRRLRLELPGHRPVTGLLHRRFDPKGLWGLACPPLFLLPGVSLRLHDLYQVRLEPGDDEDARGVVRP